MIAPSRRMAVALAALLAASAFLPIAYGGSAPAFDHPAPRVSSALPASAPPSVAHSAAAKAPEARPVPYHTGSSPTTSGCTPTPGGTPNWNNDPNFFDDALVTFSVPGQPGLSGSNFDVLPCDNVIPTYENQFWMNVSTSVPLTAAYVKIWGTSWPIPGHVAAALGGFDPANPQQIAMYIDPHNPTKASFQFNVYRYFWPGSQVYFNLTLLSDSASPSIIYSAQGAYYEGIPWLGGYNNATWLFYVASPFSQTPLVNGEYANFSQVVSISTSPNVLSTPAFLPNDNQSLQIYLTGDNISGKQFVIPHAQLEFSLSGLNSGTYADEFTAANHSFQRLQIPLGPYPGTQVTFNVSAWLPWETGIIDRIWSPEYKFNWTSQGHWPNAKGGLSANLQLNSSPDVTQGSGVTNLGTGTPVNVSIHEPIENVTIGSAAIHFRYWDANGAATGTLNMAPAGKNTSYVVIPGLPPAANLQFSVEAKDINGPPISSGNYTYSEAGPQNSSIRAGYGLFYFEAIDVATGTLVTNLNFSLANSSWHEVRTGYSLGFGVPLSVGSSGELPVAFGIYVVTVQAFGQTQSWTGNVSSTNPIVVTFFVTSAPVSPTYASPIAAITISAILGIVGASVAAWFLVKWFGERRKKIEAEQRRISL